MNEKLKSLNINSVQKVAEELMTDYGCTTTLEVKQKLRESGFFALQAEVSTAMDFLAWENEWSFTCNGQFRTYHYGEDTDMALYCLMEKGNQFWEIAVRKNQQIIRLAKQNGKTRGVFTHLYENNRQAIAEASRLLKHRQKEGYTIVLEQNEWAKLIIDHFDFLEKDILQCTLFFHSITKVEENKALFLVNGLPQPGLIQTIKRAGYEFTFDFDHENRGRLLKQLLKTKAWDAAKIPGASASLLGEQTLSTEAMLFNGVPVSVQAAQGVSNTKIASLEVATKNLYRLDIQFRDGNTLTLRKDQLGDYKSILALASTLMRMA